VHLTHAEILRCNCQLSTVNCQLPPLQETPLSPTDITIDSDFMPILKEVSCWDCV
jgi:hypothetical protein